MRACVLALLSCVVAACGGNGVVHRESPIDVPERSDDDSGDDDGGADAGPTVEHTDPIPDAAPVSHTCEAADLALCLAFENDVKDGSPNGLAAAAANVTYVPGKDGLAASLGATSSIRYPANAAFETSAATIEAWVRRSASATADGVVFDADSRYSLTITSALDVLCKTSGGAVAGGKITPEKWAHVACVVGGGVVRVYLDGVEQGNAAGSVAPAPTATEAAGGNAPSGEPFVGAMDSLRVFRVARAAADIAKDAAP